MESGYEVRVLDNLSAGSLDNIGHWLENERFEFVKGDMVDIETVKKALEGIDVIFHLAANLEVRISAQSPEKLYESRTSSESARTTASHYDFINKLRKNPKELWILGDGRQRKSYLHVSDTVEGILHIFEHFRKSGETYDVYNLGNDDWITVKEIAEIVSEEMGLTSEFQFTGGVDDGRGWKGNVKLMLLDVSKAKSAGWKPHLSFYFKNDRSSKGCFLLYN